MESMHFKSTVAIDLGAVNTGVFLVNHFSNQPVSKDSTLAATIVMPTEGDGLVYSMKNRTAVRHRIRGKKRFNLARRLLLLIVNESFRKSACSLDPLEKSKITEALCGLLKNRGYSRIESEVDLTRLEDLDPIVFSEHPSLGLYFNEMPSVAEQWENLTNDLSKISQFFQDDSIPNDKEFKQYLKANFQDYPIKLYTDALKTLKDDARNIQNQQAMGHLHRTKYLENIQKEIHKDSRLEKVIKVFGSEDRLWRLIGNISNLQLRVTRWYFNAPEMLAEDSLQLPKLQKTLTRAFKYFHPDQEDRSRLNKVVGLLKNSTDIINTLCTLDPHLTIPPYEDQNNRRPPLDQTLLLNPSTLNHLYGDKWKIWADRLQKADPLLNEGLDDILILTDRKSRIAFNNPKRLDNQTYRFSYILQRVLDRTRLRDPYKLKIISTGEMSSATEPYLTKLSSVIGSQHTLSFLQFAADYYEEVQAAKSGLWIPGKTRLLEKSDIHPPMKNKLLEVLVGNVFGADSSVGIRVIDHWLDKVYGNSSLSSICRSIETVRKAYGGEFNLLYRSAIEGKQNEIKGNKDVKEFLLIQQKIELVCNYLKEKLNLSETQIKRVANPYSLSQLYSLIETERSGFTSTCLAVHLENAWRMSSEDHSEMGAQASRLPADSVRPFDGSLRKVLDRQAWEVSKLIRDELKDKVVNDGVPIDLTILIEQNKFSFTASLATLKKNSFLQKKAKDQNNRQEKRWLEKTDRIKMASKNVCAYTGLPIGESGEIDHIIPRSLTQKKHGTIFNSEANLIYVSQVGNQKKTNRLYFLNDLNSHYLEVIFGTSNVKTIERQIEDVVTLLSRQGRLGYFDLLSENEKNCVRHALFLPDGFEAKREVIRVLGSLNKTRVNGTQAWFIRELITKVEQNISDWLMENGHQLTIRAKQADVNGCHDLRFALGNRDLSFKKKDPQPVTSHAIDAMCVYAWANGIEEYRELMAGNADLSEERKVETLRELFPENCRIINVKPVTPNNKPNLASRPLFKEGILAQEFLPLIVKNSRVFVGYGLPNQLNIDSKNFNSSIKVDGKDPLSLLRVLHPVLEPLCDLNDLKDGTYRISKSRAFDLLKKVALTQCTPQELDLAKVLEGLYYVTAKVDVVANLLDSSQKKLKSKDEILKDSNFTIKVSLSDKLYSCKGKIKLPAFYDWEKLCNQKEISDKLGVELGDTNLSEVIKNIWKFGSNRPHRHTRRIFSLPIIATQSGLIRLFRKTFDGQDCIQACNVNVNKVKGFMSDGQKVDWKSPVLFDLFRTKTVNAHQDRYSEVDQFIVMESWREIPIAVDGIKIEIAPGTLDRRYVRLTMPFVQLKKWLSLNYSSPKDLPARIKPSDPKLFNNPLGEFSKFLGTPRGDLVFEQIGDEVIFRYIVNSSNQEMNSAFNLGLD